MRDRLVENGFDDEYGCIVVHLKGQPARATRRLTKRLHDELHLPVTVFTDGDPWSYRIYGSVAYGSIKSAHLSEYLATPEADFIGIRPADIVEYDLPTDPLAESDINALESELDDPRFQTEFWTEQIELQLDLEKKSEQQALASHGLDFVTDTYLPERLTDMGLL
jgi:DNA topoisomerase-6 subunit A